MPNRFLRAGRAFLVFGILASAGVFVFLLALGGTDAPKRVSVPAASKPEVARTGKITLSAVPSAAPAEHAAAETKSVFNNEPNATQEVAKKLAQGSYPEKPVGARPRRRTKVESREAVGGGGPVYFRRNAKF
ncbi:MAG: hypothetical protein HYW56_00315 [Candidatus Harrisonbacteria bacterium]|nr:hypothetical protein [Candidatus Harrisonbacteria bacterium]